MISKPFVFEHDVANLWGQHGDGNSSWFTTMGNGYQTYTHDIMIFHCSIRLPIRGRTCSRLKTSISDGNTKHASEWVLNISHFDIYSRCCGFHIKCWDYESTRDDRRKTPDFSKCYQLQEVDMSQLILSSWPTGYWIAWRFERAPCWPSWPPRVWNSLTPFGWPRNSPSFFWAGIWHLTILVLVQLISFQTSQTFINYPIYPPLGRWNNDWTEANLGF